MKGVPYVILTLTVVLLIMKQSQLIQGAPESQTVPDEMDSATKDIQPQKRSVAMFSLMIRKATGRWPWEYGHYGCWCGLGGHGRPRDGVDWCCVCHDKCYNRLIDRDICSKKSVYYVHYAFRGKRNPRCLSSYRKGWWWRRRTVRVSACGLGKCRCDVIAVKCFNRHTFDTKYRYYDKRRCEKRLNQSVKNRARC